MANPSAEAHVQPGLTALPARDLESADQRSSNGAYAHELAQADPELAVITAAWPSFAKTKGAILSIVCNEASPKLASDPEHPEKQDSSARGYPQAEPNHLNF